MTDISTILKQVPFELITTISKIIWWIVLVVTGIFFFYQQNNFLESGSLNSINTIILLVWVVLLLMPFFQEISFYGLKVKKEIDTLKSDINNQILDLKLDLENSIALNAQINPNIYLNSSPSPTPDSQLPKLKEEFSAVLKEEFKAHGIRATKPESTDIDGGILYALSVRYQIEKELRRIISENFEEVPRWHYNSIPRLLNDLRKNDFIDLHIYKMIREIYSVTNSAIHGEEEISDARIRFIKDIFPELIAYLREL